MNLTLELTLLYSNYNLLSFALTVLIFILESVQLCKLQSCISSKTKSPVVLTNCKKSTYHKVNKYKKN